MLRYELKGNNLEEGLPYETDKDALRLAQECKFWVFGLAQAVPGKTPSRSRLGLHAKKQRKLIDIFSIFAMFKGLHKP